MWIFNRVDGVTDRQADLEENIRESLERLSRVVANEPK
jgi:hypothetical protein